MKFKFYKVESFEIIGPHRLRVIFDDRTSQEIDFAPVLFGRMYGPLRDLALFERVSIDPDVHTLVWPNGADFNPAMLHDWNSNTEEIKQSASRLETFTI